MAISAAEQCTNQQMPDLSGMPNAQMQAEAHWLTPLHTQLRLASWLVSATTELDGLLLQLQERGRTLCRDRQELSRMENGIMHGDRVWSRGSGVGSLATVVMRRANEQLIIPRITTLEGAEAMLRSNDGYANMMNAYYARILRERGPDRRVGAFVKPGRLDIRHQTCAHPFMKKGETVNSRGTSAVELYGLALRYHAGSLATLGVELGIPKAQALQKALL